MERDKIYIYSHGYNKNVNKITPSKLSIKERNQPKGFTYVTPLDFVTSQYLFFTLLILLRFLDI